jgi:hypothetical protein
MHDELEHSSNGETLVTRGESGCDFRDPFDRSDDSRTYSCFSDVMRCRARGVELGCALLGAGWAGVSGGVWARRKRLWAHAGSRGRGIQLGRAEKVRRRLRAIAGQIRECRDSRAGDAGRQHGGNGVGVPAPGLTSGTDCLPVGCGGDPGAATRWVIPRALPTVWNLSTISDGPRGVPCNPSPSNCGEIRVRRVIPMMPM